jgi:hypothetical protein
VSVRIRCACVGLIKLVCVCVCVCVENIFFDWTCSDLVNNAWNWSWQAINVQNVSSIACRVTSVFGGSHLRCWLDLNSIAEKNGQNRGHYLRKWTMLAWRGNDKIILAFAIPRIPRLHLVTAVSVFNWLSRSISSTFPSLSPSNTFSLSRVWRG